MEVNIFNYIKKAEYDQVCSGLKNKETKIIYNDTQIEIEVKKVGKKVYTFINKFGKKKLNDALNNICSLV